MLPSTRSVATLAAVINAIAVGGAGPADFASAPPVTAEQPRLVVYDVTDLLYEPRDPQFQASARRKFDELLTASNIVIPSANIRPFESNASYSLLVTATSSQHDLFDTYLNNVRAKRGPVPFSLHLLEFSPAALPDAPPSARSAIAEALVNEKPQLSAILPADTARLILTAAQQGRDCSVIEVPEATHWPQLTSDLAVESATGKLTAKLHITPSNDRREVAVHLSAELTPAGLKPLRSNAVIAMSRDQSALLHVGSVNGKYVMLLVDVEDRSKETCGTLPSRPISK